MQPLNLAGETPVDLHISHSEMRHSGGLNLTTCRVWGGHTYWKCSGGSGLMLMGAHAAQYLHIHNIWPPAPQFRHAAFLGHMGGVWLRGSGVWANRQGSNITACMSQGGTVVPDGLFHFGSRPHHPSQTVILYIELIIDVCPILYHVSYIISFNP